ncbi:MAG: threonylcarbamoyl-AMP synthase [Myxococcales bacterium]|nr:threonylcarbamoyl-AMP synthase [Myxococcales bacterium]
MDATLVSPATGAPGDAAIADAAARLQRGELVAFPTETVYGLGGDALDARAVAAIFAAKGRPADNPLIVHVDALEAAAAFARLDDRAARLAAACWPGPLSLVLPRRAGVEIPAAAGLATVAVRVPAHPVALALVRAAGLPIAAPSANRSGRPSPTTAAHVLADLAGRVPLILDGGPCTVGIESTVLALFDDEPRVLRPGGTSAARIAEILGQPVGTAAGSVHSPGTRYPHYRPRTPVLLVGPGVSDAALDRLHAAVPARAGRLCTRVPRLGARFRADAAALTHHLYADLRALDMPPLLLIEGLADDLPVSERLRRAATWHLTTDADVDAFLLDRAGDPDQ